MNTQKLIFILILNYWVTPLEGQQYFSHIIPATQNFNLVTRVLEMPPYYLIPYDYNTSQGTQSRLIKTDLDSQTELALNELDLGPQPIVSFNNLNFLIGENALSGDERITLYELNEDCSEAFLLLDHDTPSSQTINNDMIVMDQLYILNTDQYIDPLHNELQLLKVDTFGEVIWEQTINEDKKLSYGWDLAHLKDGNFLLSAGNVYFNTIGRFGQIMKIAPNGNVIWNIEGDEPFDSGSTQSKVIELSNQTILQKYEIDKWGDWEFINNDWYVQPTRFNWYSSDGDQLNEKLIVCPRIDELHFSDIEAGKGDYFFAYGSYNNEPIDEQQPSGIIHKFNNVGDTIWVKRFKHAQYSQDFRYKIVDIIEANNGDITVLAHLRSSDGNKIWLFKINQHGCFGEEECNELIISSVEEVERPASIQKILVYPNPSKDQIEIKIPALIDFKQHQLFDINGTLIFEIHSKEKQITLDINSFPAGFYFLNSISSSGKIESLKIVKL